MKKINKIQKTYHTFSEKDSYNVEQQIKEISQPSYAGDKSKCLLFSKSKKKQCWGLILEEKISKNADLPIIYFHGAQKWEIKYKEKVVLQCDYNVFSFDQRSRESTIKDRLPDKLKKNSSFIELYERLAEQQHGALVIIANDAEVETERLCDRFKRGTRIEPLDLKEQDALSIISGFCSVDGAIFIDFEGKCHGYGVILDGIAKRTGVRGRGARYNSALNYIAETDRYAIVASEDKDKGICILPE